LEIWYQTPYNAEENAPIITATEAASAVPDSSLQNFLILSIYPGSNLPFMEKQQPSYTFATRPYFLTPTIAPLMFAGAKRFLNKYYYHIL
jgi:hypothetical protein